MNYETKQNKGSIKNAQWGWKFMISQCNLRSWFFYYVPQPPSLLFACKSNQPNRCCWLRCVMKGGSRAGWVALWGRRGRSKKTKRPKRKGSNRGMATKSLKKVMENTSTTQKLFFLVSYLSNFSEMKPNLFPVLTVVSLGAYWEGRKEEGSSSNISARSETTSHNNRFVKRNNKCLPITTTINRHQVERNEKVFLQCVSV